MFSQVLSGHKICWLGRALYSVPGELASLSYMQEVKPLCIWFFLSRKELKQSFSIPQTLIKHLLPSTVRCLRCKRGEEMPTVLEKWKKTSMSSVTEYPGLCLSGRVGKKKKRKNTQPTECSNLSILRSCHSHSDPSWPTGLCREAMGWYHLPPGNPGSGVR